MSRKLMAMMLAIGLVIGLVGGFFGGYFYNNFKAAEGTPPGEELFPAPTIVREPINVNTSGFNWTAGTSIVVDYNSPYNCPDGFDPNVPMPFYKNQNPTALVLDQKGWVRRQYLNLRKREQSENDKKYPFVVDYEYVYDISLSDDGLAILATLTDKYKKQRPNPGYDYISEGFGNMEGENIYSAYIYESESILGSLVRGDRIVFEHPPVKIVCSKPGSTGGGTGGQ